MKMDWHELHLAIKSSYAVLLVWSTLPYLCASSRPLVPVGLFFLVFVAFTLIMATRMPSPSPKTWYADISPIYQAILWAITLLGLLVGTRGLQEFWPSLGYWLFLFGILTWICRDGLVWAYKSVFGTRGG